MSEPRFVKIESPDFKGVVNLGAVAFATWSQDAGDGRRRLCVRSVGGSYEIYEGASADILWNGLAQLVGPNYCVVEATADAELADRAAVLPGVGRDDLTPEELREAWDAVDIRRIPPAYQKGSEEAPWPSVELGFRRMKIGEGYFLVFPRGAVREEEVVSIHRTTTEETNVYIRGKQAGLRFRLTPALADRESPEATAES